MIALPDWMTSIEAVRRKRAAVRRTIPATGCRVTASPITARSTADSPATGRFWSASTGLDRFDNWAALSPQDEKDRRERWLDAFQAALDRDYPGFSAAVVERMFLNARSMHNFMNTPDGAVYGFAPLPFERGIWAGMPRFAQDADPVVYLASSFAGGCGFSGAMRSGADAARMAMKERAR